MRIHPEIDKTLYLIDQNDYTIKYCDFDQNVFEFEIMLKQERSSLYIKILENGQIYFVWSSLLFKYNLKKCKRYIT